MAVSPARADVRARGRAARQALRTSERPSTVNAVLGHLRHLHALQAASIGAFIAHDGEPELKPLIEWLWDRGSTVALPVLEDDPKDFSMRFVPWRQGQDLTSGRYGIPVPPDNETIEPETLLVSFTGFDAVGNRIGRGAGFFDRYLADYAGTVVGVGFECQRFDQVPVEPHDQALPVIVTDLGVRYVQ